MTVFWIVLDGAAAWLVDELCGRGALPAISGLRAAGQHAALEPSTPSCQTPPGLATLFTGASVAEHGIDGFFLVGGPDGDPAGWRRAFDRDACRVPMAWQRAGEAGLRSLLLHAPWTVGPDGSVGPHVSAAVEAFSQRIAREKVVEVTPTPTPLADLDAAVSVRADPDRPGTLVVSGADGPETVVGAEWVAHGRAWYRARVSEDGRLLCLRSGAWRPRVAGHDPLIVERLRAALDRDVFVGESMGALYRDGWFGPRLGAGGAGEAERLLLDGARLVAASWSATVAAALAGPELPELVVIYVPWTDDLGHELASQLDGPHAATAWDLLARGYGWADDIVDAVRRRAGAGDTVVLSADHGMSPTTVTFYPNNVLVRAGLATAHADGADGADYARSRALYHIVSNGLVLAGGAPGAGATALDEAIAVLRAVRDPATGAPVVREVVDGRWLVFAPGVLPWPDVTDDLAALGPPLRSGSHTVFNGDPRLLATFAVAGPPGDRWSLTRNAEVAGLVLRAAGGPVPRAGHAGRPAATRLCVVGHSGAGKSTLVGILAEVCARRSLALARLHLATPLYRLQQAVRAEAGVLLDERRQDQLLMEALATHLRRLNPRALVDPLLAQARSGDAEVIVVDDLRDPDVDAPALRAEGFLVVRVVADDEQRHARRLARGDVSTSDASAARQDEIDADHVIENRGPLADYRERVLELVEKILDTHRA